MEDLHPRRHCLQSRNKIALGVRARITARRQDHPGGGTGVPGDPRSRQLTVDGS
ncbi:hypothetical protein MTY_0581 [Moorella thermoacetica Y72]|uniref:Uncharacterized protein n=1 Tax=Moorella thermoacetica Y72 TaxID=1325331 RepID=A0A0S6UBS5_NEOTH|nr:hypothetical protein MTY_0581 [Moorella thermoacetica Y72]